ncbi:MAG: Hpt domain-containing protein [Kangiellaceae bacterium]|nr:Hpt domain-containing protein [Kangiellaceae bacterium]
MEKIVDDNMLDELCEIMGDDINMLIESYISDSKAKLIQIAELDPSSDQENIFRLAHSLKGSSRNIGVLAFSNYCDTIENNARDNCLNNENYDLEKLNGFFNEAVALIGQRFKLDQ